jgi:hypothetical protein
LTKKLWATLLLAAATVACGGEGVSGPSNSIPNVAGNYVGTVSFAFPELAQTVACTTTTSVTQASGSGNINVAPLLLAGTCAQVGLSSLPMGPMTIDTTGSVVRVDPSRSLAERMSTRRVAGFSAATSAPRSSIPPTPATT